MAQIAVKDAVGSSVLVARIADTGTAAANASLPVTLSTEDKALLTAAAPTALTSRSGSITTGGVSQTLAAANSSRRGFWVHNLSTGDLWVNPFGSTAAATQPSFKLAAGALYEAPAGGAGVAAITIFGATTGQQFAAGEY